MQGSKRNWHSTVDNPHCSQLRSQNVTWYKPGNTYGNICLSNIPNTRLPITYSQIVCINPQNNFGGDDCKKTTEMPSFDDTILKEFVEWAEGRRKTLNPMAASDLGFDNWLYALRDRPIPTLEQDRMLKMRILYLAYKSPLSLWSAIENYTLPTLLGKEFGWVETPKRW